MFNSSQTPSAALTFIRIILIFLGFISGLYLENPSIIFLSTLIYATQVFYLLLKQAQVSDSVKFVTFLCDTIFISFWLSHVEGVMSGWISLLMVPAITSSLFQSKIHAWIISFISIGCYGLLIFVDINQQSHAHHTMSSHLIGMFVTFSFSVIALTAFISFQSDKIRRHHHTITQLNEQQWRERQIVALATLSANITHQIATPLSTASLLIEEWMEEQLSKQHTLITQAHEELTRCQTYLKDHVARVAKSDPNALVQVVAIEWVDEQLENWWIQNNEVALNRDIHILDNQVLSVNENLAYALWNILDNAKKAMKHHLKPLIHISVKQINQHLTIDINDNGKDAQQCDEKLKWETQPGSAFVYSEQGLGIGLTLARSIIQQFGGGLSFSPTRNGTKASINLPLNRGTTR